MAEPFLSEIRLMSFHFPPKGWAHCNGQLLPINQNQALFALLGTTYGGDGQTSFALPDLRDRVPMHVGNGHTLGERGGEQAHRLSVAELPTHTHGLGLSTRAAASGAAAGAVPASAHDLYAVPRDLTALSPAALTSVGGSQPHPNMQPFLTLSYCIALQGIFPSPS